MKRKLLLIFVGCLLSQWSSAQASKWVEKAKKAIFSVVTYDQNDKILNTGNGFFVTEDGVALSDCGLFYEAQSAVIITSDGKKMPVEAILGANGMYDVVKFQVAITEKKVPALSIAGTSPAVGTEVYVLPYSTQKGTFTSTTIKEVAKAGEGYFYYTLGMPLKDKMVSCPVMSADGQVFGLAQKSSGRDTTTISYAASAAFAMSQKIAPLSFSDITLKKIGIRKGLPDTEDQALVFLYMASTQTTPAEYQALLDAFIKQYPNSTDGYIRRATSNLYKATDDASFDKVVADMEQALKVAQKKDDVYYNYSKLIYNYQMGTPETTYKDWTFDKALEYVRNAESIDPLPVYVQLEGDIFFAQQKYTEALACYQKVNESNLASPLTFYTAAKTMELTEGDPKEVAALMDSCIARCPQPLPVEVAPFVLERAQAYMLAELYRPALADYDTYYDLVNGRVNDVFYHLREQAAFKGKQYQRALDDIAKAIELKPDEMLYRAEQAVVNLRVGRYDEALKILKEAVAKYPEYAEGYRLMGICQIQLKKNADACTSFAKAKELGDPNVDELISKHCN